MKQNKPPRTVQEHLSLLVQRSNSTESGHDRPASRDIFDRAYSRAMTEKPAVWRRLLSYTGANSGPGQIAAAFLVAVAVGLTAFHLSDTRHIWSDFRRVGTGDLIQAGTERKVTIFHGLSPAKVIRLEKGASLRREQNHWELANGAATVRIRKIKPGNTFHLRSGNVHLVSTGPVEYSVRALNEASAPTTVMISVQEGTVHCCAAESEFPIVSGEKITLQRAPGAKTQILAFESE